MATGIVKIRTLSENHLLFLVSVTYGKTAKRVDGVVVQIVDKGGSRVRCLPVFCFSALISRGGADFSNIGSLLYWY